MSVLQLNYATISGGVLGEDTTVAISDECIEKGFYVKLNFFCSTGRRLTGTVSGVGYFTLPLEWANTFPNASLSSVTVQAWVYTAGGAEVAYESGDLIISLPGSVKPSCTYSITDPTGYLSKYGGYVSGKSKFCIAISPSGIYGSSITSCEIRLTDGSAYTATASPWTITTEEIPIGLSIHLYVTDSRGSRYYEQIVLDGDPTVYTYTAPAVGTLTATRCKADGTVDHYGEYVKVTYATAVHPLGGNNSAVYVLKYKKASATTYTTVTLSGHDDKWNASGTYIFAADTGSVYDVQLTATDDFNAITKGVTAPTSFVLMHFNQSGTGVGFGKISELDNVMDAGMRTRHMGGLLHVVIPTGTNLNTVTTPNTYAGLDASSAGYSNCPITSGAFTLEVLSAGGDDKTITQRLTACINGSRIVYERHYTASGSSYVWDAWLNPNLNSVYPVGSIYMSVNSTSPASFIGGTWARLQNRFLLGAGSSYTAGVTGGAATHTLSIGEMPTHAHTQYTDNGAGGRYTMVCNVGGGESTYGAYPSNSIINYTTAPAVVTSTNGGGQAHNNMPPYLVVYMWKRTA